MHSNMLALQGKSSRHCILPIMATDLHASNLFLYYESGAVLVLHEHFA